MNNSEENIPNEIFDWINTFSYQELNPKQQMFVSHWFSPNTYNLIHQVAKHASEENTRLSRKSSIKHHLLNKFELKYQSISWHQKAIPWWQPATIIILLLAIISSLLVKQKPTNNRNLLALTDTIYIEKQMESAPIYIHDTVYLNEKKTMKLEGKTTVLSEYKEHKTYKNTTIPNHILVQGIDALESTSNQIKGNSLKDDTLLNTYGFVRL